MLSKYEILKVWTMMIAVYGYVIGTSIATFGWFSLITIPAVYYLFNQMAKMGEELDE